MDNFLNETSVEYINQKARVIVALSGGVDSSVVALILKSSGFEVLGVTLKTWDRTPLENAKNVADSLDIQHFVVDVVKSFRDKIIKYFMDEYSSGRTPNPCVICNDVIKFYYLLALRDKFKADYVATGHYAKVCFDPYKKRFLLKKGKDLSKDQSYMLYRLKQDDLSYILFPLSDLAKEQVWEIARESKIPIPDNSESQEICFLEGSDYRDFLKKYKGSNIKPGLILDTSGNPIGTHKGLPFYTIGQRKGINIPGDKRLYVIKLNPLENTIVVGEAEDLLTTSLIANNVNWVAFKTPPPEMNLNIKIRYKAKETPGLVMPQNQNMVKIVFNTPQKAVTPGQSVVFYDKDILVGGGIIV